MSEKLKEIIKNMPKDVLINTFKTVYEDSIMKDLEIERLNNIINELEEKEDKLNEVIKLVRDYEELEQIVGIGKPPFQLYKLQEIVKGE